MISLKRPKAKIGIITWINSLPIQVESRTFWNAKPMKLNLYCDGGVIGKNPSTKGGTWAWCLVHDSRIVLHDSGVITPADFGQGTISNNDAELYAALRALDNSTKASSLWTDSYVTLCRLTGGGNLNTLPKEIQDWVRAIRKRNRIPIQLLSGHPTKKELLAGIGKGKRPVSIWNVWCDRKCTEHARAFQ